MVSTKLTYHQGEPLAVPIAELRRLDGVLISHAHYDHCDLDAFKKCPDHGVPMVVAAPVVEKALQCGFENVTALQPWQDVKIAGVTITAASAKHAVSEITFVLQADGRTVFFGGDTQSSTCETRDMHPSRKVDSGAARDAKEGVSPSSRANQKDRTRQALRDAAQTLFAGGIVPTISETARCARVSVATAYRYYSDSRSLVRDALASSWPEPRADLDAIMEEPSLPERARMAGEAMARRVLAAEAVVRAVIATSYSAPKDGEAPGAFRPMFRTDLVEVVLGAAPPRLDARSLQRLRLALLTVVSAEAVLALKDVAGCEDRAIVRTIGAIAACVAKDGAARR